MSDDPPKSALAPETSPLVEADPNSLNEFIQSRIDDIFNKPPLELTDDDLRVQVEYYQKERLRFLQESLAKETKEKTKTTKVAKVKAPTSVAEVLSATADLL